MGSLLRVSGDKREDDLDGIAMGDIHAEQKSQYFNNPLQVRVPRRNGGGAAAARKGNDRFLTSFPPSRQYPNH